MTKSILLGVAIAVLSGAVFAATTAPPRELDAMRKVFAAAIGRHDVKAVAALTAFPLTFSGYEHPDTVSAAKFASEFDGLFFEGEPSMVKCLAEGTLEPAQGDWLPKNPWVIDCNGNEYYFGLRDGKWRFTAYENINE